MVAEFTGVPIDTDELGGPAAHARFSGVASLVVTDDARPWTPSPTCSPTCPLNNDEEPPRWPTDDPVDRPTPRPAR